MEADLDIEVLIETKRERDATSWRWERDVEMFNPRYLELMMMTMS